MDTLKNLAKENADARIKIDKSAASIMENLIRNTAMWDLTRTSGTLGRSTIPIITTTGPNSTFGNTSQVYPDIYYLKDLYTEKCGEKFVTTLFVGGLKWQTGIQPPVGSGVSAQENHTFEYVGTLSGSLVKIELPVDYRTLRVSRYVCLSISKLEKFDEGEFLEGDFQLVVVIPVFSYNKTPWKCHRVKVFLEKLGPPRVRELPKFLAEPNIVRANEEKINA